MADAHSFDEACHTVLKNLHSITSFTSTTNPNQNACIVYGQCMPPLFLTEQSRSISEIFHWPTHYTPGLDTVTNTVTNAPKIDFNPFTPESDQCQNSPAASQEI